MRRFVLIDPCLCDIGSHPYHYALDVLEAAERSGFACYAVANRRFLAHAAHWPARFGLEGIFAESGHSKYTAFGELDRLSPRGRPLWRLSAPWAAAHANRRRAGKIAAFARSVEPVVRRLEPGDRVFIATATELDVAGLARAIRNARPPDGIAWHAQFHYPLYRGLEADFARQERRLDRLRRLLAGAVREASPHAIHLHVTTDELAAQYDRLGVGKFTAIPYPVRPIRRDREPSRQMPLRIAALGDARPEKHSHLLADLAARAAADPALAGRLVFAVQSNPGFDPESRDKEHRAVLEGIHRLASLRPGTVELIGGPLSADAYAAQLAAADATLLAYDQDRYRCRCSGVLLESLASGIVPIVTGGGWMARMLMEPMRRHIDEVVTRSTAFPATTLPSIRIRPRHPWTHSFEPPAGITAVVVRLQWAARRAEAIHAASARVEIRQEGRPAAVAAVMPDPMTGVGEALLPAAPRDGNRPVPLRLSLAACSGDGRLDLAHMSVQPIEGDAMPPVGAAGIVVPPGGGLVDPLLAACRELVANADHYRRTAAAHAAVVASRFSGDRVIEALSSAGRIGEP